MASPTRINLEEPVRVASTTRINLEELSGWPAQLGLPGGTNFFWLPSPHKINLEEPVRVASPKRINSFLCLSVFLSVRVKRVE